MGLPVPLHSLPSSPDLFCMLPGESFNLFEKRVGEFSPIRGLDKAFGEKVGDFTGQNFFLAGPGNQFGYNQTNSK